MQPIELQEQNICIHLSCKPFRLDKQRISGTDIHLHFTSTEALICPECDSVAGNHAYRPGKKPLSTAPIPPYKRTSWHVAKLTGECPCCELKFTKIVPFQFKNRHLTIDIARKICEMMDALNANICITARILNLQEDMVRRVHKEYLLEVEANIPEPKDVKSIAVDEFSILKGHQYASLVLDISNKQPVFICQGRTTEEFKPFFSLYSKDFYKNLQCVSMDQNHTYATFFKQEFAHVDIVSDRYHMTANYFKDVMDKVRLRTARKLRAEGNEEGYRMFKHANYLLFTPKLKDSSQAKTLVEFDGQLQLGRLMEMNEEISKVSLLYHQLRALYEIRDEMVMLAEWEKWLCMCELSGIEELVSFALKKRKYTEQIIMHAKYPVSSGIIEGCMNTIKVIKRAAWGFRDFGYFFLRIKYAFLPYKLKQEVKDKLFGNCSEYLLPPIDHQKCG
ncbi:MAG: ISL3 family transposase [Sphaerochaeta sp.]|nr:ISL3 family transposase [Sphaerochaeta sp.]